MVCDTTLHNVRPPYTCTLLCICMQCILMGLIFVRTYFHKVKKEQILYLPKQKGSDQIAMIVFSIIL